MLVFIHYKVMATLSRVAERAAERRARQAEALGDSFMIIGDIVNARRLWQEAREERDFASLQNLEAYRFENAAARLWEARGN